MTCNPNWSEIKAEARAEAERDNANSQGTTEVTGNNTSADAHAEAEVHATTPGALPSYDRPDLIARRVFDMKLASLLHDIKERNIFGRCIGLIHVIQWQKRGLPYAHIVVFLAEEDCSDAY